MSTLVKKDSRLSPKTSKKSSSFSPEPPFLQIYDSDSSSSNLSAHDFLGELECTLGEIVSTPSPPFTRKLSKKQGVARIKGALKGELLIDM